MLNEKKIMKENNIEVKATIEMSLGLLGGMEANEQMDTQATEEHSLKRDIMEALERSDEKMDGSSRKTDEK